MCQLHWAPTLQMGPRCLPTHPQGLRWLPGAGRCECGCAEGIQAGSRPQTGGGRALVGDTSTSAWDWGRLLPGGAPHMPMAGTKKGRSPLSEGTVPWEAPRAWEWTGHHSTEERTEA